MGGDCHFVRKKKNYSKVSFSIFKFFWFLSAHSSLGLFLARLFVPIQIFDIHTTDCVSFVIFSLFPDVFFFFCRPAGTVWHNHSKSLKDINSFLFEILRIELKSKEDDKSRNDENEMSRLLICKRAKQTKYKQKTKQNERQKTHAQYSTRGWTICRQVLGSFSLRWILGNSSEWKCTTVEVRL